MWNELGTNPEILVTDNAKEFISNEFSKFCFDLKITHYKIGIEAHRNNGRVERMIRTIRDSLTKNKVDNLEIGLQEIEKSYNNTYHHGIKCTPHEAYRDFSGIAALENSKEGRYITRYKEKKGEKLRINQQVRISRKDNLREKRKENSGRYIERGVIVAEAGHNGYLVRNEKGRIIKKGEYELKSMNVV